MGLHPSPHAPGSLSQKRLFPPLPSAVSGVSKHKTKQPRPFLPRHQALGDIGQLPSRPQSAQQLVGDNSGSFLLNGVSFHVV